jgi:hypothetical protein
VREMVSKGALEGELQPLQDPRNCHFEGYGKYLQRGQTYIFLASLHVGDVTTVYSQLFCHFHLCPASSVPKSTQAHAELRGDVFGGHPAIIVCRLSTTNRLKTTGTTVICAKSDMCCTFRSKREQDILGVKLRKGE